MTDTLQNHKPAGRKFGSVTLRPVMPDDEQFLFEVYVSTRRDEMDAWGWDEAQGDAFLKMQFMAQRQSYAMLYPNADHSIILVDQKRAGRLYVARSEKSVELTDISLLPEYRGQGIGSGLIKDLLDEAAESNKPCRLQVLRSNSAAARLYERLGFVKTDGDAMYIEMEWKLV